MKSKAIRTIVLSIFIMNMLMLAATFMPSGSKALAGKDKPVALQVQSTQNQDTDTGNHPTIKAQPIENDSPSLLFGWFKKWFGCMWNCVRHHRCYCMNNA